MHMCDGSGHDMEGIMGACWFGVCYSIVDHCEVLGIPLCRDVEARCRGPGTDVGHMLTWSVYQRGAMS